MRTYRIHKQKPIVKHMNTTFPKSFQKFACEGDRIEVEIDGFTITALIERDSGSHIDDCDLWNPDQSVTGCDDEQFAKLLADRKAWENDEWFFCGIVLSVSKAGIVLDDHAASLWGIECNYPDSDNSHLTEVANELLPEALEAGRKAISKLVVQ